MIPLLLVVAAVTQMRAGSADTLRYRFESKNNSTIDLSAYGQPSQDRRATTVALLTMIVRDSGGGRVAHVVVDSLSRDDGGAMNDAKAYLAPELTASGKGAAFDLFLVDGKSRSYSTSMPGNLDATAVSAALGLLFPGMRGSAKVGDSWTDTTRTGGGASDVSKSTEIARWTRTSTDTLDATVSSTMTSTAGAQLGTLVTNGSGTRRLVLDARGAVHDATSSVTTVGTMGEVQIKGTTTATLSRIP